MGGGESGKNAIEKHGHVPSITPQLTWIRHTKNETRGLLSNSMMCRNTLDGRHYLADDKGFVCSRFDVNMRTGCCMQGVQYSCRTCTSHHCCGIYEFCVACCSDVSLFFIA
jgi:hypothetical protein